MTKDSLIISLPVTGPLAALEPGVTQLARVHKSEL
jgi:hypothetical protein